MRNGKLSFELYVLGLGRLDLLGREIIQEGSAVLGTIFQKERDGHAKSINV